MVTEEKTIGILKQAEAGVKIYRSMSDARYQHATLQLAQKYGGMEVFRWTGHPDGI